MASAMIVRIGGRPADSGKRVEALNQGKTTLEIYGFDKLIEKLMA